MRKPGLKLKLLTGMLLVVWLLGSALAIDTTLARPRLQEETEAVHLVIELGGDPGNISLNRLTWDDIDAKNPLALGMSIQPTDYLIVAGRSSVRILCADLTVVNANSNGNVRCDDQPQNPAFINMDVVDFEPQSMRVLETSSSGIPDGAQDVGAQPISARQFAVVENIIQEIGQLGLDGEMETFAIAMTLASHGLYYDAINILINHEDLQCDADRPVVDFDADATVFTSPIPYLRLGEWYAIVEGTEASQRYLECALNVAQGTDDVLTEALVLSRLAVLAEDSGQQTELFQAAINNYDQLTASEAVSTLLGMCGTANCRRP